MVDADLEHLDGAMQHRIMQRRQMELARRNRLLDAKRRTLGQDMDALKAQVEEKKLEAAESAEAKSEEKLEAQYLDSVFALQEKEISAEKLAAEKQTRQYSQKFCAKVKRKEYHLSDPDALKREKPLTDEQIDEMGPSSILSFGGYRESAWNLSSAWINSGFVPHMPQHEADGIKEQKEEFIRQELEAQKAEKAYVEEQDLIREAQFAEEEKRANMLRTFIEQQEKEAASAAAMDTRYFNHSLQAEVAQRRKFQAQKEEASKQAELAYNKTSQLLNEAEFQTGPDGRVLPDTFKRMTQDQVQVILDTQAYQMIEKRQRAEAEKEEELEFARQLELQRQCVDAIEAEKMRRTVTKRAQYAAQFKEDARLHQKAQAMLGEQYGNKIDDSFFNQFGKSGR
jgi:hypothetical protein